MRLVKSGQRVRSYGDINRYGLCGRRSVIYDTEITATNAYLVEQILSSRIHQKRLQHLVRWSGYSSEHDMWVPHTEFDFDDSLVVDFHTQYLLLPSNPRRG
jgi:hypothetical protein